MSNILSEISLHDIIYKLKDDNAVTQEQLEEALANVGNTSVVIQNEEPEDKSVIWIDPDDNSADELDIVKTVNGVGPDTNGNIQLEIEVDMTKVENHIADKNNPHEVTAEQINALPISGGQMNIDSSIGWESDDFFMEIGNPDTDSQQLAFSTIKMNDGIMHVTGVNPNIIMTGRAGYEYQDLITITNEGITSTDVYEYGEIGLSRIIDDERNGEKLKLGAFELTHTTVKDSNNADIVAGSVGGAIISGVHTPLADDHAVNKKYVDEAVASGGSVKTVNNVEPDENGNIELTAEQVGAVTKEYVDNAVPKPAPNGTEWTQSNITNGNFNSVYYANNIWVAGGTAGLYHSTDGMTWTQSNITNGDFNSVYYGNGIWAAGSMTGLYYSTDGMTWSQSNIMNVSTIYYANGIWTAGLSDGTGIWYSEDGVAWAQSNFSNNSVSSIYYSNGLWVAGSGGSGLYYSTDGKTWAQGSVSAGMFLVVYYANGLWVASRYDAIPKAYTTIYYSIDGITWTRSNLEYTYINSIYYANNIWVAGSTAGLYYSTDGMTWVQSNVTSGTFEFVYNANSMWVTCSNSGLYYSTDGMTWTQSNVTSKVFDFVYNANGMWIACSNSGLYYSVSWFGETKNVYNTLKFYIDEKGDTKIITDATSGDKTITFTADNSNSEWRYVYASGIVSLTLASSGTFANTAEAYYSVVFISGTTATTITNTIGAYFTGDDCVEGVFTPAASKTYDLGIWWNGVKWQAAVRGSV